MNYAIQHLVKRFLLFFALMTTPFLFSISLYAISPDTTSNQSLLQQIQHQTATDQASSTQVDNIASGQGPLSAQSISVAQAAQAASGTATIRTFVWEDTDLDGIQLTNFGENPIPNVKVTLYHSNGLIAGIRTTHSDGFSEFSNLAAGRYYLSVQFPRGLVPTHQNRGNDSTVDSDIDQITGLTELITVEEGVEIHEFDSGFTHAGSILSKVWSDQNLNGIRDNGEMGVPATVVTLYNDDAIIVQSVPTDMTGIFEFPIVTPGVYTLGFSPPPGMSFTQKGVYSSALYSEADPQTGLTSPVQVTAGPNNFDWGAGLIILVPTALETIAEPTLQAEVVERKGTSLFMPIMEFGLQPSNTPPPSVTQTVYETASK